MRLVMYIRTNEWTPSSYRKNSRLPPRNDGVDGIGGGEVKEQNTSTQQTGRVDGKWRRSKKRLGHTIDVLFFLCTRLAFVLLNSYEHRYYFINLWARVSGTRRYLLSLCTNAAARPNEKYAHGRCACTRSYKRFDMCKRLEKRKIFENFLNFFHVLWPKTVALILLSIGSRLTGIRLIAFRKLHISAEKRVVYVVYVRSN